MANMEKVLDIYKQIPDPGYPVVCMDESPKQLISETRVPIPEAPGRPARHDYEYRRCGVCNIFLACEPLSGKRMVSITEKRAKSDWAYFIEEIAKTYEDADKIIKDITGVCKSLGLEVFNKQQFFEYIDTLNKESNEIFEYKNHTSNYFKNRFNL